MLMAIPPRLLLAVAAMPTTEALNIHAGVGQSMHVACSAPGHHRSRHSNINRPQRGFTLVELIVFIVVISLALGAMLAVYQQSVVSSVDPIKRIRMLELAQAQLDRVMAQRYAEETPMGGIPACNPCTNNIDGLDDVDDYDGVNDTPAPGYRREVTVTVESLDSTPAKRIEVKVIASDGEELHLAAYRVNF